MSTDREMDKESDLVFAKSLIARNAADMTMDEKMEFVRLLMDKGVPDETE